MGVGDWCYIKLWFGLFDIKFNEVSMSCSDIPSLKKYNRCTDLPQLEKSMIKFRLNDQEINVPSEYKDITYAQYLQTMYTGDDTIKTVSILLGIDEDTLRNAEIKGLNTLLSALSFISTQAVFDQRPTHVGPYEIPKDISIESLAQFEDLRALSRVFPKPPVDTTNTNDLLIYAETIADMYLQACAIYCQKIRDGKYNFAAAKEMKDEIKTYSCAEVMPAGAFFIATYSRMPSYTKTAFPKRTQPLKKKKRG